MFCIIQQTLITVCVYCILPSDLHCFATFGWASEEHPACENWVMSCLCGHLSGTKCRLFAYGQADATAPKIPKSLASFKSRLVLPFWYQLNQVVLKKRPLNWCSSSSVYCVLFLSVKIGTLSTLDQYRFFWGTWFSAFSCCVCAYPLCLQCFDAVGWATGRASGL